MAANTLSNRGNLLLAVTVTCVLAALAALTGAAPVHAAPRAEPTVHSSVATTRLTITAPTCDRCKIQLVQAIRGRMHVWQSRTRTMSHGTVTFTVPTARTRGMSMSVRAPWESSNGIPTGYVTMAVFRYQGHAPGSSVDFTTARLQRKASACWAGTGRTTRTLRLGVRKVIVQGNGGRTNGTIAWLPVQQHTWAPMLGIRRGIFGAQDAVFCDRP